MTYFYGTQNWNAQEKKLHFCSLKFCYCDLLGKRPWWFGCPHLTCLLSIMLVLMVLPRVNRYLRHKRSGPSFCWSIICWMVMAMSLHTCICFSFANSICFLSISFLNNWRELWQLSPDYRSVIAFHHHHCHDTLMGLISKLHWNN